MAERRMELRLNSPAGGEPLVYQWPLVKTKHYDASAEILQTIRTVMGQYEELRAVMQKCHKKLEDVDVNNLAEMREMCDKFSKAADTIKSLWKGATRPETQGGARQQSLMLRHVVALAYNRAVAEPDKLNHHYEAFSSLTYGETTFDRMQKIIEEIRPRDRDVFVDLGSGVGQVVAHMAGGSKCRRCVGIEMAELPAEYAATLSREFARWMKWYGQKVRPFELKKADFLDPSFHDLITKEATILFINNYAFTPDLENKIKTQLLQDLKDGTKIISTRPYCPLNVRLSDRQMSNIAAIMDVKELSPCPQSTSWTCNTVQYYLHTINRSKLEEYFRAQRNPSLRELDASRRSSTSKSSSRDSSVSNGRGESVAVKREPGCVSAVAGVDDDGSHGDGHARRAHWLVERRRCSAVFGPTTRRQWNDWVSQQERNRKDKRRTKSAGASVAFGRTRRRTNAPMQGVGTPRSTPDHDDDDDDDDDDGGEVAAERKAVKAPRGRPRKHESEKRSALAKRPSDAQANVRSGLDLLHQLTVSSSSADRSPEGAVYVSELPLKRTQPTSRYPALDVFIDSLRERYEKELDYMQTGEFRTSVEGAIEEERKRGDQLRQKRDQLSRQVARLQKDGVMLLKQRLNELNIQAETPAEILNQSKEIVLRHNELETKASMLEKEVHSLHVHNQSLVRRFREQDEHTVQSGMLQNMGFPDGVGVDGAKEMILREIGMHFSRQRALLGEIARMESEVVTLQANLPPSIVTLMDKASVAAAQPSVLADADASAATVAAQPTAGRRGGRSRTARSAGVAAARKRPVAVLSSRRGAADDPQQQEEIERQIQDIVQKALSVDNAVKAADRDRRLRAAERKRGAQQQKPPMSAPNERPSAATSELSAGDGADSAPTSVSSQSLTFASPGLVPVYTQQCAAETDATPPARLMAGQKRKRWHSASSSETESAPSEGDEVAKAAVESCDVSLAARAERPSSVPTPRQRPPKTAFRIENLVGDQSAAYPRVQSAQPSVL